MTRHAHGPLHIHRHGHRPFDIAVNDIEAREARPATTDQPLPVETVVSVVYVTAPKTFDGPAIYVTLTPSSKTASRPTTRSSINININTQLTASAQDPSVTSAAGASGATNAAILVGPPIAPSSSASAAAPTLAAPTVGPSLAVSQSVLPASIAASTVASFASAAAAPVPTATPNPSSSSGQMPGGAKAGLALGILVAVGAVLTVALCLYGRKKRRDPAGERLADEKGSNNNSAPAVGSEKPGTKTMSTAPRLSLRPLTVFLPNLAGDRKSTAINPDSARATNTTAQTDANGFLTPGPQQTTSVWERQGAQNSVNDPSNPFGNHAETVDSGLTALPTWGASPRAESGGVGARAPVAAAAAAASLSPSEPRFAEPSSAKLNASALQASSIPTTPAQASNEANQPALTQTPPAVTGSIGPVAVGASTARAAPLPPSSNNVHRVQLDFKPSMDDEIELRAGQLVRILHEYDDGWALCIRMDRSQQGVAPRTCLSRHPVKPRPAGPPSQPRQRGTPPHMRPAPSSNAFAQSRSLSPSTGHNSPVASGRNSPAPYAATSRGRARSNAEPYAGQPRALSPEPYGTGKQRPVAPVDGRRRSNSMGQLGPSSVMPMRKPVPGRAL